MTALAEVEELIVQAGKAQMGLRRMGITFKLDTAEAQESLRQHQITLYNLLEQIAINTATEGRVYLHGKAP